MNIKKALHFALFLACAFIFGCEPIRSVEIKAGTPPPRRDEPQVERKAPPGPPPHAPAYGRRAQHRYRYYPDSEVYYDDDRRVYFYLSGGSWRVSANLPGDISVRLGTRSVEIDMDSDKPYTEHGSHKAKYPPGQLKKRGDHVPPGQAKKHGGDDDDDHGKGHGKGHDKGDRDDD